MMKNVTKISAAMMVGFWVTSASALTINSPMYLNSEYIVGIIDQTAPLGSEANELIAAQKLLDLGVAGTDGYYKANTSYDYDDTLLYGIYYKDEGDPDVEDDLPSTLTISGWDYVLAKYDGPNAGYVLFYTNSETLTIPEYPSNFWTTRDQYAISHWTAFNADPGNPVPEPATMLLFGAGIAGLAGIARRKRS